MSLICEFPCSPSRPFDLQRDDLTQLSSVWTVENWQHFLLMCPWKGEWLHGRVPILYTSQYGQDMPTDINETTLADFERMFQGQDVDSISFALATQIA